MKVKLIRILLALLLVSPLFAGNLDPTFDIGSGADGIVEQVLPLSDGRILICGNFTTFNGKNRAYVARLNSNGSVDESFWARPGYWVRNMALQADGKIVIGGYFTTVEGQSRNLVARLNADGSLDSSFNPGLGARDIIAGGIDGNIDPFVFWVAIQPDGKIIFTGNFRNYNGASSTGIVRVNPDGSRDTTFNVGQGFDSWGRHVRVLPNGQILVGGWFTAYNGRGFNRLARINPDGSPDASFTPFFGDKTAIYSTVALPDGKYIAAGHSLNEQGLFRRELARLNPNGTIDESWVGSSNEKTESLVLQPDGKLIAVGNFTLANNTSRRALARYNPDGTLDDSLQANIDNFVWGAALQNDGKLLISGGFWTVDGVSRRGVARLLTGLGGGGGGTTPDPAPALSASAASSSQVNLTWSDSSGARTGYAVERKTGAGGAYAQVATLAASARSYSDNGLAPATAYFYRLRGSTSSGSTYSNEAQATTASGGTPSGANGATFAGSDTTTRGSWKNVYGADGYTVIGDNARAPVYGTAAANGKQDWTWQWSTSDAAALQKVNASDRLAACWYADSQFSVDVRITDGQTHRIGLYLLDWDLAGRRQTIQVVDGGNGALLDTRTASNFGAGVYMSWDVKGFVKFVITRNAGPNAVLSGLFFGGSGGGSEPPQSTVATPMISPNGGTFASPRSVTLSSATSGAEIRYTTNGSEPTSTSTLYTSPLTISSSTTLKAKAFKSGMVASATASASFTIDTGTGGGGSGENFAYAGQDTTTKGNWRNVYGTEGYSIFGKAQSLPAFAQVSFAGKSDWIWNDTTTDTRALQIPDGTSRIASTWYSAASFDVNLNFTDGKTHRIALYFMDWDNLGRSQRVELVNASTGAVLQTENLSGFSGGRYYIWDVKGAVKVRVTKVAGPNAVLNGLFIQPSPKQL